MHRTVSRYTHCVHGLATGTYPVARDKISPVRISYTISEELFLILSSLLCPGPLSSICRIGFVAKNVTRVFTCQLLMCTTHPTHHTL